jgi:hypothetical protein
MKNVWLTFLLPVDDSSVSQPVKPAPGLTIGRALVLLVTYLVTNNLVGLFVLVFCLEQKPASSPQRNMPLPAFAGWLHRSFLSYEWQPGL